MTTTPATTDLDLDALKALLDAMPEGPWRVALSQPSPGIRTAAGWEVVHASYDDHLSVLEFIAAARNALPALLDELAKTRRERDVYRYEVGHADAEREEAERNRDAAREELAKVSAELARAKAEQGRIAQHMATALEPYVSPSTVRQALADVEANPATTAEPADEPCDPTAATLTNSAPMLCADCGKRHKTQVRIDQAEPADEPLLTAEPGQEAAR